MSTPTVVSPRCEGCRIYLASPFAALEIEAPCSLSPVQFEEMLPILLDQLATLHADSFLPGQAADGHRYLFGNSLVPPYSIDLLVSTTNVSPGKFVQDRERIVERLRQSYRDALTEASEGGAS